MIFSVLSICAKFPATSALPDLNLSLAFSKNVVRDILVDLSTNTDRTYRKFSVRCRCALQYSVIILLFIIFFAQDRYNPSNVGILEDYLYHQIRSQEYDCLANLAILKLSAVHALQFQLPGLNRVF